MQTDCERGGHPTAEGNDLYCVRAGQWSPCARALLPLDIPPTPAPAMPRKHKAMPKTAEFRGGALTTTNDVGHGPPGPGGSASPSATMCHHFPVTPPLFPHYSPIPRPLFQMADAQGEGGGMVVRCRTQHKGG